MSRRILRPIEIAGRRGDSKSSLYADIRRRLWPRLVAMGARSRGQPEDEVDQLIAARIAGKTDTEIKELVLQMEAARKSAYQGAGPSTGAAGLLGPHA